MAKEYKHPRHELKRMMRDRDVNITSLAKLTGLKVAHLTGFLMGAIPMCTKLAIELETKFFGRAKHWVMTQALYDLQEAKKKDSRYQNKLANV